MLREHMHAQALLILRTQYRMARGIQDLANHLVYNGQLRAGSRAVEATVLEVRQPATGAQQGQCYAPWLQQVNGGTPPNTSLWQRRCMHAVLGCGSHCGPCSGTSGPGWILRARNLGIFCESKYLDG